jgi:predicted amidohydrolase
MRIVLAQLAPELGELEANLEQGITTVSAAAANDADLVVFPELYLTGANVGSVERDLGLPLYSQPIRDLGAAGGERTAVGVGFVRSGRRANYYNSFAYLEGEHVVHCHQKAYLPTYDIFEEGKVFTPGSSISAFNTRLGRVAALVCNDAWQPPFVFLAVQDGAQVLLVPANSAESSFDSIADTRSYWRQITSFYALLFQCYVVFVNRVGTEGGMRYWGSSHVLDPWGRIVAEAPMYQETVLTVDIDLAQVHRRRRQVPFLKESRIGLLAREFARLNATVDDD